MSQAESLKPTNGRMSWFVRLAWLGPTLLSLLFLAILGGLLWQLKQRDLDQERSRLAAAAESAEEQIRGQLKATRDFLVALAEGFGRDGADKAVAQERLEQYLADHAELVDVLFADAQEVVGWSIRGQAEGEAVGAVLTCPDSRKALARSRRTGKPVYSDPHVSVQSEAVFDLSVPVVAAGEFRGGLIAVYSFERLLRQMLPRETLQGHRVSLLTDDGRPIVALPAVAEVDERLVRTVALSPPGHGVALRLMRYGSGFWGVGLTVLTVLCVALVGGMAWGTWQLNRNIIRRAQAEESLRRARDELADRVRARTADLEDANVRLRDEMRERQSAEQRARERLSDLAHVGRVSTMGEMATGLAHELNQPLGSIVSYAEGSLRLLEGGQADPGRLHQAISEISEQAGRAGQIIRRLREFVANGRPRREPCDVGAMAEEVIDLLAMDIRQEQIELRTELPEGLSPVLADRIQIQQVLLNLMHNAVDAMSAGPPDGRMLSVSARFGNAPGRLEIAISDTGPGCPQGQIDRLFEPFYSTKESGIGMGLAISRSIVQAHGGRLWAEAAGTHGLTFRFTLPTPEGEQE